MAGILGADLLSMPLTAPGAIRGLIVGTIRGITHGTTLGMVVMALEAMVVVFIATITAHHLGVAIISFTTTLRTTTTTVQGL